MMRFFMTNYCRTISVGLDESKEAGSGGTREVQVSGDSPLAPCLTALSAIPNFARRQRKLP
jgi:hypothetical protein